MEELVAELMVAWSELVGNTRLWSIEMVIRRASFSFVFKFHTGEAITTGLVEVFR